MPRTKTEALLADAEVAHANDPERAEILRRARLFKASWIELAESLTRVKRGGAWKGWGYDSFEGYAKSELRLRQETVDKLTGSYTFLQRRAPSVLSRDALAEPIPSYQAIDFLRRAEASESAPRDTVAEIRRRVLEDCAPARAVASVYRDAVFPVDDKQRLARETAGLRNVAKRLRELLSETEAVPRKIAADARIAIDRLLEAVGEKEERAA